MNNKNLSNRIMLAVIGCLAAMSSNSVLAADSKDPGKDTKTYDGPYDTPLTLDERFAQVGKLEPSFGGMYYDDNGDLNVVLTDTTRKMAAALAIDYVFGQDMKTNHPSNSLHFTGKPILKVGDFKVVKGKYSASQMVEWKRKSGVAFALNETQYIDFNERTNQIVVGVSDKAALSKVKDLIVEQGVPSEALEFEVTSEDILLSESLITEHRPIKGGIVFDGHGCTLGFNANLNGVRGFVGNSHCTDTIFEANEADTITIFQPYYRGQPWDQIGIESIDPPLWTTNYFTFSLTVWGLEFDWTRVETPCPIFQRCRFSDSFFGRYYLPEDDIYPYIVPTRSDNKIAKPIGWNIAYDVDENDYLQINPADPELPVYTKQLYNLVGIHLDKIGKRTGWTWGTVVESCVDRSKYFEKDGRLLLDEGKYTLLCQDTVRRPPNTTNFMSGPGDSGAPVFVYTGSKYGQPGAFLAGIMWGQAGGRDGGSNTFLLSPMGGIERDLGELSISAVY